MAWAFPARKEGYLLWDDQLLLCSLSNRLLLAFTPDESGSKPPPIHHVDLNDVSSVDLCESWEGTPALVLSLANHSVVLRLPPNGDPNALHDWHRHLRERNVLSQTSMSQPQGPTPPVIPPPPPPPPPELLASVSGASPGQNDFLASASWFTTALSHLNAINKEYAAHARQSYLDQLLHRKRTLEGIPDRQILAHPSIQQELWNIEQQLRLLQSMHGSGEDTAAASLALTGADAQALLDRLEQLRQEHRTLTKRNAEVWQQTPARHRSPHPSPSASPAAAARTRSESPVHPRSPSPPRRGGNTITLTSVEQTQSVQHTNAPRTRPPRAPNGKTFPEQHEQEVETPHSRPLRFASTPGGTFPPSPSMTTTTDAAMSSSYDSSNAASPVFQSQQQRFPFATSRQSPSDSRRGVTEQAGTHRRTSATDRTGSPKPVRSSGRITVDDRSGFRAHAGLGPRQSAPPPLESSMESMYMRMHSPSYSSIATGSSSASATPSSASGSSEASSSPRGSDFHTAPRYPAAVVAPPQNRAAPAALHSNGHPGTHTLGRSQPLHHELVISPPVAAPAAWYSKVIPVNMQPAATTVVVRSLQAAPLAPSVLSSRTSTSSETSEDEGSEDDTSSSSEDSRSTASYSHTGQLPPTIPPGLPMTAFPQPPLPHLQQLLPQPPPQPMVPPVNPSGLDEENRNKFFIVQRLLMAGRVFKKHCVNNRAGKVKSKVQDRFVFLTRDGKYLQWSDPKRVNYVNYSTRQELDYSIPTYKGRKDHKSFIPLEEIRKVVVGLDNEVVIKKGTGMLDFWKRPVDTRCLLSFVSNRRTLTLEVSTPEEAEYWASVWNFYLFNALNTVTQQSGAVSQPYYPPVGVIAPIPGGFVPPSA
eukprot:TRINITY_DN12356_c0_g1_i1.p1 TRINITY_DN12356_c0_g1~~TRINITY_DN12356_c0_g1_i1.p1  ORF type:complete len:871 (-),score=101.15 TRINITY_DN12356_c0_g1_i1:18-2630(-)